MIRKIAIWSSDDMWGRYPGLDNIDYIIEVESGFDPIDAAIEKGLINRDNVGFFDWIEVTEAIDELFSKFK